MPRLSRIIKGHHYQIARFAGRWYVVDLDKMKFIYGPFDRRETAASRLKKLPARVTGARKKRRVTNPTWISPRKGKRLGTLYRKAYQRFERENPGKGKRKPVLIYGRVLKIFAQKTEGPFKGQRFVHTFKPGAVMVGMPDGSLRISHP
jgi:hypothetical protein